MVNCDARAIRLLAASAGVGFYANISVPPSIPPMLKTEELHDALVDGAIARPKSDPEGLILFLVATITILWYTLPGGLESVPVEKLYD